MWQTCKAHVEQSRCILWHIVWFLGAGYVISLSRSTLLGCFQQLGTCSGESGAVQHTRSWVHA